MLQKISKNLIKMWGWKTSCCPLTRKKYVIIGAPHTSNWDFPLTLLALSALGLRFSWVAKHSIFIFPLGALFRRIGGVAVNRRVRKEFLSQIMLQFSQRNEFMLAIAPEGTRSYSDHWKCGFYEIALEAGVDIALGFADYSTKTIGIKKTITPSGDLAADMEQIAKEYYGVRGKYPDKEGKIAVRPKELKIFNRRQARSSSEQIDEK